MCTRWQYHHCILLFISILMTTVSAAAIPFVRKFLHNFNYIFAAHIRLHVHFVNNKFHFKFQAAKKFAIICLITACLWLIVSFRWLMRAAQNETVAFLYVFVFQYSDFCMHLYDFYCLKSFFTVHHANITERDSHHIHIIRRITNGCKISTKNSKCVRPSIY